MPLQLFPVHNINTFFMKGNIIQKTQKLIQTLLLFRNDINPSLK